MKNLPQASLVMATAALAACSGVLGGDEPGAAPIDPTPATDAPATTLALPLRRLSKAQYTNTIDDLLAIALPAEADAVKAQVALVLARMPDDALVTPHGEKRGGFHRLDQAVQQTHADIAYAVGNEIGKQLTSSPARLEAVFGHCITEADRLPCVSTFLRTFGERVLRRPITDDDITFYETPLGGAPATAASLADVIALLFSAPDVLYLVERDGTGTEPTRPLGAYELAARLSYHLTETLPDKELLDLARSGALAKDDIYATQVDRLAASPRARAVFDELFAEWLRLDELERLDSRIGDPVFDAFAAGDTPTADLRDHMFADVLDATAWVTAHGGTLAALLQKRQSFARTEDLAKIYGVPVWDGKSEPPRFPDPSRAGLVTRAAFLATGSANTRPIMKGVRLRTGIMCDAVGPPPPNAMAARIDLSPTLTTRQVVELLTQGQGSSCSGCHTTMLNPLGFATENFDALGRIRHTQRLFDRFGNAIAEREIDTFSIPRVLPTDERASHDAVDVTRYLVESKKVELCFARNLYRFSFARAEAAADAALIDALAKTAAEKPLAEVLKAVALRPEFRSRTITEAR